MNQTKTFRWTHTSLLLQSNGGFEIAAMAYVKIDFASCHSTHHLHVFSPSNLLNCFFFVFFFLNFNQTRKTWKLIFKNKHNKVVCVCVSCIFWRPSSSHKEQWSAVTTARTTVPLLLVFLGLPFLFSILLCRAHQIVEKYDWETFVEPISSDVTCAPNKNNATVKSRKWNTHTHTSATIKTVCSRRDIECRNSNI